MYKKNLHSAQFKLNMQISIMQSSKKFLPFFYFGGNARAKEEERAAMFWVLYKCRKSVKEWNNYNFYASCIDFSDFVMIYQNVETIMESKSNEAV